MQQGINIKSLFISVIFSLCFLLFYIFKYLFFLHDFMVVCDVGQGDGLYFRINNNDIVMDSGSGKEMLYCLGKYMPFWDKKIELAVLTHPQKDHYGGFLNLVDEYQIEKFVLPSVYNASAESYRQLLSKIYSKKTITKEILFSGDYINIGDSAVILLFWPENGFVEKNTLSAKEALDFNDQTFYDTAVDLNLFSYTGLLYIKKGDKRVLFTGDLRSDILVYLLDKYKSLLPQIDYFKQPHHGSKTGFDSFIFKLADINNVLISVGKNNPYGHPDKNLIDYLTDERIRYFRTDIDGDIFIKLN